MLEFLLNLFTNLIERAGYAGVAILMALESMVAPVPSEAVMPFAGFLWYQGHFNFWLIILFSTLGSIIGSLISYYIGYYAGRPIIVHFGKYLLLNEHHLDKTEKFFNRFGGKAVFISRFIPIVRHLISIPAGAGKMNIWKFSVYTVVGAGLWNAFLTWLGFYFGKEWSNVSRFGEWADRVMVVLIVLAVAWFVWEKVYKSNIKNLQIELLGEIKDKEFPPDESKMKLREASRAVLFDENGLVPLLFVSNEHYYKLPGGGIDKGEDKIQALIREVKEEVGSAIEITGEVGKIIEHRSKWNLKQVSYCYLGKIISKGKPEFTEGEVSHGFELVWLNLDEAISKVENARPEGYEGACFIQKRDLIFLKKAREIIAQNKKF
ncbi:MAG: VTT domain-containing protein [Parcubacteria group bacterium]